MSPAALLLLLNAAAAQDVADVPQFDTQLYRPDLFARHTLWTQDTALDAHGQPRAGVVLSYAHDPFVFEWDAGDRVDVVSSLLQADLMGGITLGRARFAVGLPVIAWAAGEGVEGVAGLGDLALDTRVTLYPRESGPVGVALSGRFSAPTATLAGPFGTDGMAWELAAVVDRQLGDLLLAANVGTRGRPEVLLDNVVLDDQLFFRLGGGYALADGGVSLDLVGGFTYQEPLTNRASSPMEVLAGGWYGLGHGLVLRGGLGTGLTRGVGAPLVRQVLVLTWQPEGPQDRDLDGILDGVDACPEVPEDADGWEDTDGCPDLDDDQDGIADARDACPREAEDPDGYRDDDGCPDPSTRMTLYLQDLESRPVPGASLQVAGAPAAVGAPGTFVVDLHPGAYVVDAGAEGFQPLRADLTVPAAPVGEAAYVMAPVPVEVVVPPPAPPGPTRVTITREKIEIAETVYFELNRAEIKPESFGLLDEVAQVLRDHPEILRLRIEGHTDSRGSASSNQELSERRARAVRMYLLEKGVETTRLDSVGFGESRPVDPRETEEAWTRNRRVDFFIVERAPEAGGT